MIDKAVRFATHAHSGFTRKGNNQPYIFHPLEVLSLASLITTDKEILTAAVLHDAVEDAEVKIEDIRVEFGERVAKLVAYESEDKRGQVNKSGTWLQRKQETIDKINSIDDIGAKIVCLCDKVSNLRSIHMLFLQIGDDVWNNFNMRDPKMHYWYYSEIAKALSELKDYAVYKEYLFLIDAIFTKYVGEKAHE